MSGDLNAVQVEGLTGSHQNTPGDHTASTSFTSDTLVERGVEDGHPPKRRQRKDNDDASHKKKGPQKPQSGQKFLGLPPLDAKGPDLKALGTITKTPLPAGLKFPKELSLEQLQSIIYNFHQNETRTDILTPLPQAFQPEKSVFSFLYTMNTFLDPTVRQNDLV